jgi:hypothetical protein
VLQGNGMITAEGGRALLDLLIASASMMELDLRHTGACSSCVGFTLSATVAKRENDEHHNYPYPKAFMWSYNRYF